MTAFKLPEAFPFKEVAADLEAPAPQVSAPMGGGSDGKTLAIKGLESLRDLPLGGASGVPFTVDPGRRKTMTEAPQAAGAAGAHEGGRPPVPPAGSAPMSLGRHASLCLELALDPGRTAEAMARYQVSPADKARADEYYRVRCAADPELRAQWNEAYATYHAWFTARQG